MTFALGVHKANKPGHVRPNTCRGTSGQPSQAGVGPKLRHDDAMPQAKKRASTSSPRRLPVSKANTIARPARRPNFYAAEGESKMTNSYHSQMIRRLRVRKSKACAVAIAIAVVATWAFPKEGLASIVTHTYSFTASDFSPIGAPQDPVIGSFNLSFDPAGPDVTDSQIGIHLDSINIQFDSANISYDYVSAAHGLIVGGIQNRANQVLSGNDDFSIAFTVDNAGDPVIDASHTADFFYSQTTTPLNNFIASAIEVTIPEPGTLGLMFAPLFWLFAGRRRCDRS
jgi:hypothetical protein